MTGDVGKDMVFSADIKDSYLDLPLFLLIIYSEVERYPMAMNVEDSAYVLEAIAENPVF